MELNAQLKENRAQHQMIQMMMAALVSHNNPNSFVGQNINENAVTGIGMVVKPHEVNDDVHTAENCNHTKMTRKKNKLLLFYFQLH